MTGNKAIKSAMESMMFTWGEPLEAKMAADVFNITKEEAYECFKELQAEYEQEGRGIVIREVNKAFQFVTREENADYVRRLCTPVKAKKLSQSALEVLAIIAYKQPVTKGEMEAIRGIKCDRVVEGLMNKNLIEEVGRSSAIGRPILYGTTDTFLKNFGFTSLKELPDIEDIESVINDDIEAEPSGDEQDPVSAGQMTIEF
ncbi:segregation and condensation protein B [Firmicutes bacterium CAG:238]|jgi:segregation and condensation protein B|nr:segregation and condensation protein B [Firmicutes bacterium CAG:238]